MPPCGASGAFRIQNYGNTFHFILLSLWMVQELFTTKATRKRFFSCTYFSSMNKFMFFSCSMISKNFIPKTAWKWFFTSMNYQRVPHLEAHLLIKVEKVSLVVIKIDWTLFIFFWFYLSSAILYSIFMYLYALWQFLF